MNRFGLARVSVCSPVVAVGNPHNNVDVILAMLDKVADSDVVVFPELAVTGYTCRDLFRGPTLVQAAEGELSRLAAATRGRKQLLIVGAPVAVGNELFNCAVAINDGRILGVTPKQNIPNYSEFEEARWFRAADGDELGEIDLAGSHVPFGIDLLFAWRAHGSELIVGIELCEDLWMPIPPSCYQALAGANLLVNLSASNETVSKCEYREQLVTNQSGRCVAAYAYVSAGPSESTTDLVFGGHSLIAENGAITAATSHVGDPNDPLGLGEKIATADIDVQKLQTERRLMGSFGEASRQLQGRQYRAIPFVGSDALVGLKRQINGRPFVPQDPATLAHRCAEIFGIECAGLYRRLETIGWPDVNIGVSGGLDSTLALIVAARTYQAKGLPLSKIGGLTMPGFGTSDKTKANALKLMAALGVRSETIDIRELCLKAFQDLHYKPFGIDAAHGDLPRFQESLRSLDDKVLARGDLNFENVQARVRTMLLMSRGFVIGTGDLSELALGWSTYNADHMSMYNPNCGVPKTLVKFLVEWVAEHEFRKLGDQPGSPYSVLIDITNTTVSPELLPIGREGQIVQSTESVLGPYELHDFYLRHFVRDGFSPDKILYLSDFATFSQPYQRDLRERTLQTFLSRFFAYQFKRSCVPDGPKVGTVSLSPRGDWRMPSDADPGLWLG